MNKFIKIILKVLNVFLLSITFLVIAFTVFLTGYVKGYNNGQIVIQEEKVSSTTRPLATIVPSIKPTYISKTTSKPAYFSGPQLWEAVNKRRVEFGVNPLKQKDELCTIASIRLNQLLELGKLDGHEGFGKLPTDRADLKWIFDQYNVFEFLVSGATSPQNAVDLWENTLGHKKLLSGGEYSWGCIYAQSGFGVAIVAY
jgi:uncharacterized protein YkwD